MACEHPRKMFRTKDKHPSGKPIMSSNPLKALNSALPLSIPCGQCISCRLDKADIWATRLKGEAQMHEESCFITMTYDPLWLPTDYSLRPDHWVLFMKRFRARIAPIKVRFCACGEYGDDNFRPHYHALIFGYDFPDKTYWMDRKGYPVWKSELLEELWGKGICEVGSVTADSAGYVARYCLKKYTGQNADAHYYRRSPVDGALYRVSTEFLRTSRRPGIGGTWFDKFHGDCFPSDFLIVDGRHKPVPGYYLRRLDDASQVPIKQRRKAKSVTPAAKWNNTPERLRVRGEVRLAKTRRLVRGLH